MNNVKVISTFNFNIDVQTNIPTELYIDSPNSSNNDSYKILLVIEPNEVSGIREIIINNKENFNTILTWDEEILDKCNNSKLFPFGTTWISNYDYNIDKEFKITTLVGGKSYLTGHKLRQKIVDVVDKVNIGIDIFNSRNYPYPNLSEFKQIESQITKNELFYSQYHIVIENEKHKNYFTEKLIDCFQTKTIPIYYGCPNIGDFFNEKGILTFNDLDGLVNICNRLNEDNYSELQDYINENYELSFKYSDLKNRIEKIIPKLVGDKI